MKKNITHKLFYIVWIPGLLGVQQAYAATYYVSPTGSNSNNGTSLSSPVKTINQALSKAQSSGDIIYVMTGTYVETVSIDQSGITLSAYQNEKPVIDGQTKLPNADWGTLISINGNNNKISGFEVINSNINGTYVGGYGVWVGGNKNTVSKINVHHTWQNGILINGDYNIVEDSTIWQSNQSNSLNHGAGWGSGLSAARNNNTDALKPNITSYATIRRNKVFNNWGEGISCYEADHCTIEDNIVYDNYAVNLYLSDTSNSLVQRNLVYVSSNPAVHGYGDAITLADEVPSVPRSANNTIINNFIYNSELCAFCWTVTPAGLNNVLIANNSIVDGGLNTGSGGSIVNTNSQIRNNIITGKSSIPSNSGITFSDNNWSANPPAAAAAATNIVADPQIARTGTTAPGTLTSAYFKISGSSPVINAAMPLNNVSNDYFQVSRGTAPDIGGHEFQTSGGTTTSPTDSTAPSAPFGLGATSGSATQVSLVWNASTDNVGVTGYEIYRNGTEIKASNTTNVTDTTVTSGTTYNYTIKAYDAAGNLSAVSNTATVTIPQATSAVNISSHSAGSITANSANISWTTNIPSTGVISYGTSATNLSSQVSAADLATSHSVQINGLARRTTYYYRINSNNGPATATSSFSTARRW